MVTKTAQNRYLLRKAIPSILAVASIIYVAPSATFAHSTEISQKSGKQSSTFEEFKETVQNPKASPESLDNLARKIIPESKSLDPQQKLQLLKGIVKNKNASLSTLDYLSKSKDDNVRMVVAANTTDMPILFNLANDIDPKVRFAARMNIIKIDRNKHRISPIIRN